ncbi:MAG: four helix bundle protein [Verrucomicrobiota bacterium]
MAQIDSLQKFKAYQKACLLFDQAVSDMSALTKSPLTARLISQQVASADSIAANIEEGYGRGSKKDYAHFLVIARGSATETRGRYSRMKHWLSANVIAERVALCDEIIAILTSTIRTLRNDGGGRTT